MNNIDLADFFELTPDLVWLAGKDGYLKKVNRAVVEKLGYSLEELYSRPVTDFMHPDDVEITVLNRNKLFTGEVMHNFCNRYVTKNGNIIWMEWTSLYLGEKDIILAIAKDITARKKIEKEVADNYNKFKGLAFHFKSRIEKDRKFFTYELHEEIAQLVSVINMDVSWLNLNVNDLSVKVKERVEHASEVCKLMIRTIQRLSFSISTKMLDDFGLINTMEWLCKEFSILNSISCDFESTCNEAKISKEIKIDIFRICQDALTDVLNYSLAGNIMIYIKEINNNIELRVYDTRDGFNPKLEKQQAGVVSIQERATSINGSVTLHEFPDGGSGICILMPAENHHDMVIATQSDPAYK